ncbi:hypothetical protein CONPUDRAFT_91410 [Coniophora puteana RWD-64-598 SS2]|uniref:Tetratricopeptide SHNi-TPR domain-containing protein n=1 Tax=Coniophora puteana (strain RWD-64-598) TaxID=741705 RepID=A0A5M3MIM9_CONPW|nr:uncharacterized protein CONPUDRAFT_91410 [Coniophora puteana RWD-64-598 SS2]EIW79098.1 hypothetical protein CONPUDRAFT_91410 [Coniophora puteana RWD-64-598 SS2]
MEPKTEQATEQPTTVEGALEQARRAFALRRYEQAVEHYAMALEIATKKHGEDAPEMADLYFSYGKALLENAIVQSQVLGKDEPQNEEAEEKGANGAFLSFSGDAEEEGDPAVDLFANAAKAEEEEEEEDGEGEGEEEGGDGEPEDDFNAAWEVLELARAIYDRGKEDDGVTLKLADTYIALGDVSLETEKFDQAITDYEEGLKIKLELLPVSSRQIAEAHYKLTLALDLTPGRLSDAIVHAEKALDSVEHRLAELRTGIAGQLPPPSAPIEESSNASGSGKGKGKGRAAPVLADDAVQKMSKEQMEKEIKEVEGLREDLAMKVEELKTSPNDASAESAPAMAARALDAELNAGKGKGGGAGLDFSAILGAGSATASAQPAVVNDLTSMVVKKKKKAPANASPPAAEGEASGKRKAEDGEGTESKKAKLEGEESSA